MVHQMTKIARATALGYLQAGWNISQVVEKMGRHKSAISKLAMKATEFRVGRGKDYSEKSWGWQQKLDNPL